MTKQPRRPTIDQSTTAAWRDLLSGTPVSRRTLAYGAAGLGTALFAGHGALAQPEDGERFFLFVELRGGVHWSLATDGRDLAALPLNDPATVCAMPITATPPAALQELLKAGRDGGEEETFTKLNETNGRFLWLPYLTGSAREARDSLHASYTPGVTGLGAPYVLGFAGAALRPHLDDIAVVRGVHMAADFHGRANVEAFAVDPDNRFPHVAAVLTKVLADKTRRPRLLDNIVFENATFVDGSVTGATGPIRMTAATLAAIARGATGASGIDLLDPAAAVAGALGQRAGTAPSYRQLLQDYKGAAARTPDVRAKLAAIRGNLGAGDASLNLLGQMQTAAAMFTSGLSRVATVCYGAKTDQNDVDGFGLFDAHTGMYHGADTNQPSGSGSFRHHEKVGQAMTDLAAFIRYLKATDYGDRKLWDVVCVVVTSEFGRPSNFSGNEGESDQPGCGHYPFNNNYILFGAGIRGGAWIGGNDPIRQMGHLVDLPSLASKDPTAVRMAAVTFEQGGTGAKPVPYPSRGPLRPLQSQDVVKTVLHAAGVGEAFAAYYTAPECEDAAVLQAVLR